MRLDILDGNDLTKIIYSHSVAPHQPGRMCSVSPSKILYEDRSGNPCRVHWLDCSELPPKPAAGKTSIITRQDIIWDMCLGKHKGKHVLITSRSYDGIFAYSTKTNRLLWRISGSLTGMERVLGAEGITTDSNGHLFVSDYRNKCIQMFSLEGVYMKPIIKGQSQSLSEPVQIRWCNHMSSLIVAHKQHQHYGISVIEETDDYSETSGEHSMVKEESCLELPTESVTEDTILSSQ